MANVKHNILFLAVGSLLISLCIFFPKSVHAAYSPWLIDTQDFTTGNLNGQNDWLAVSSYVSKNNFIQFTHSTGFESVSYSPGVPISSYGDELNFNLYLEAYPAGDFTISFKGSDGLYIGNIIFTGLDLRFHSLLTTKITLTAATYYNFRVRFDDVNKKISYSLENGDFFTRSYLNSRAEPLSIISIYIPANWSIYSQYIRISKSPEYQAQKLQNFNTQFLLILFSIVIYFLVLILIVKFLL